ncbi:predicted protein [Coccidioides posadasii str. Silveira]|uniref:Predicted protein n=1 Tax=Coccidioides posadasii (strain RMSCC 757 / Silveira) TaxID=443226 RepID=E9CTE1_COCPS|nr:predicted protein [Coccidioides posadasii str. Silveira]
MDLMKKYFRDIDQKQEDTHDTLNQVLLSHATNIKIWSVDDCAESQDPTSQHILIASWESFFPTKPNNI